MINTIMPRNPAHAALVALLVLHLSSPPGAGAKAAFAGKAEMVRRSDAIAVVDVLRVEKVEVKGTHWTYSQRAVAEVRSTLKRDLPAEGEQLLVFGGEDFICAQCRFEPGRHLLFLRRDGGLWVGSNWHLSVRPIVSDGDGKEWVDWYVKDNSIELKPRPLAEVLAEVRKLVAQQQSKPQ